MPKLNTTTIWTPIFEWYMVTCETNNGHQRDKHLKKSRPHVQNMLTIIGPINNKIRRTYMTTQ